MCFDLVWWQINEDSCAFCNVYASGRPKSGFHKCPFCHVKLNNILFAPVQCMCRWNCHNMNWKKKGKKKTFIAKQKLNEGSYCVLSQLIGCLVFIVCMFCRSPRGFWGVKRIEPCRKRWRLLLGLVFFGGGLIYRLLVLSSVSNASESSLKVLRSVGYLGRRIIKGSLFLSL